MSYPESISNIEHLVADLTEPQRQAVLHVDGPLLVLAGAGSGKTRVITRRIAHLVQHIGIAPWNVLAITFTNKAAAEMRHRLGSLLTPRQTAAVTVGTFHSVCARVLRQYADRLGFPASFSIFDSSDQQRAVKRALEQCNVSSSNFPPSKLLHTISSAKNDLIDAESYATTATDYYGKVAAKVFLQYQQTLRRCKAMDFDDLIANTIKLMRNHPDVLTEINERFQYILIDEYQDTNHAQFILANAFAGERQNLCATGDPDQSIYGWRGANIRNILEFEQNFPTTQTIALEQNYRSTKNILAAANALIQNNTQRKHKGLWTENETGDPIRVTTCMDERQEATYIADEFRRMQQKYDLPWSAFAVFYRTNSLSRVMEETLLRQAVPYQIARGTSFFDRKEIKDAVSFLRAVANPLDEINLARIINTPARGISNTTVKALQAKAVAMHTSIDWLIHHPEKITSLNKRAANSVQKFADMLDRWRQRAGLIESITDRDEDENLTLCDLVQDILQDSGLETYYRNDKNDEEGARIENLGELVSSAKQYETDLAGELDIQTQTTKPPTITDKLLGYLEQIALVSDVDAIDDSEGMVTLMTLHAAKGLEFPVVAIVGMEDGLLPHERSLRERDIEEERRLCFVGITRAKRFLLFSHARFRTIFGKSAPTVPSRFISELPQDIIEQTDATLGSQAAGLHTQIATHLPTKNEQAFPIGSRVRHRQFGVGHILSVKSSSAHTRARVNFLTAGVKTLILEFAKLERLD